MCYSAQIWADYRRYVRMFGAHMDIAEFARLYFLQAEGNAVKTPKALDNAFREPQNDAEREIRELMTGAMPGRPRSSKRSSSSSGLAWRRPGASCSRR